MTTQIQLGLVGFGKIARDQHLPAIARAQGIELVAVASPYGDAPGVRNYPVIEAMLAAEDGLDAVVLCQPPQARFEAAQAALAAGKHVFLEKPPGATVSEVEALRTFARDQQVTLFTGWHSQYGAAVLPAKAWIAARAITAITISWREDVRVWHPGQDWIWRPGGFGVFDPGINALSILTRILDEPVHVVAAELETPGNRHAPIAARLAMATTRGVPVSADFDFRQIGQQIWDIAIEADGHRLVLGHGGNRLSLDGVEMEVGLEREYPAMYEHFIDLVRAGHSDVDLAALQLVADAFLCGRSSITEPFED